MSHLYEAIEKARREGRTGDRQFEEPTVAPRIRSGLSFAEGATVSPRLSDCLVALLREDEPWVEQLRTLATRLRAMEGSERVRRIGLMSAVGGEGKTTLAIALSFVLAEDQGERVLLVDADLRHRQVEFSLGVPPSPGLTDWLRQPSPELVVRRVGPNGPFLLSAGRPSTRPWELVASPHLATVLEVAGQQFRYVVTDCPAEGPVADAARIQEHLDALLLVVRARTAPRDAILSTVEHLQEEKVLGVLFNGEVQARDRFKRYRYSTYHKSYLTRSKGKGRGRS
jgi:Mrp family chromosome partitioning ATPase